ncbi:hypothetical protein RR42_m3037 [Cupriavidus basilensis]|uniref:Uncharacterized protein n=1 Tax=Cupriavidus basilensis TaxID=68895 RepID=A0A0C4YBV3_9BURK|nr:hypothetical protein RR42_m3037 [Cupriavidus basilensis]
MGQVRQECAQQREHEQKDASHDSGSRLARRESMYQVGNGALHALSSWR